MGTTSHIETPEQWVLKAVQATVAGGCSSLSFRVGRSSTEVRWTGAPPCKAEDLRLALESGHPCGQPFLDELATGLRDVRESRSVEFQSAGVLRARDGRFESSPTPSRLQPTLTVTHPGAGRYLGFRAPNDLEATVEQCSLLRRRCPFSPVPIRLDGELLGLRHLMPQYPKSDGPEPFRIYPLAALELEKRGGMYHPAGKPYLDQRFSTSNWSRPAFKTNSATTLEWGKALVWCCLPWRPPNGLPEQPLPRQSIVLHWLRHGVVCASQTILSDSLLGLAIGIDDSDSPVDSLGLHLHPTPVSRLEGLELSLRLWRELSSQLLSGPSVGRKLMSFWSSVGTQDKILKKLLGVGRLSELLSEFGEQLEFEYRNLKPD